MALKKKEVRNNNGVESFGFFEVVYKYIRSLEDKLVAESYINQIKSYVKLLPVVMTNTISLLL